MAAAVGAVSCTFVKGAARDPTQRVVTYQVPGIDGVAAQLLGEGDSAFRFSAVLYGTAAELTTWIAAMIALKGDIVTIEDDWGISHANCLIVRLSPPRKRAASQSDHQRCEMLVEGVIDS